MLARACTDNEQGRASDERSANSRAGGHRSTGSLGFGHVREPSSSFVSVNGPSVTMMFRVAMYGRPLSACLVELPLRVGCSMTRRIGVSSVGVEWMPACAHPNPADNTRVAIV
jgi:hypothetical protein